MSFTGQKSEVYLQKFTKPSEPGISDPVHFQGRLNSLFSGGGLFDPFSDIGSLENQNDKNYK